MHQGIARARNNSGRAPFSLSFFLSFSPGFRKTKPTPTKNRRRCVYPPPCARSSWRDSYVREAAKRAQLRTLTDKNVDTLCNSSVHKRTLPPGIYGGILGSSSGGVYRLSCWEEQSSFRGTLIMFINLIWDCGAECRQSWRFSPRSARTTRRFLHFRVSTGCILSHDKIDDKMRI